jgi:parvulin-like peptidyl-prolyl isomerase
LPKKKIEKPQREMTKRQMSHWQRESRMQRFTMIGGIIVIVAILAVVGTGLYMNKYRPFGEKAVTVENTTYSEGYMIDLLSFMAKVTYPYMAQIYQQLGQQIDLNSYLNQAVTSLPQEIGRNQIIRESAASAVSLNEDVTISTDEITQYIKDNKLSDNQAIRDAIYSQLLNKKLGEYFDKQVPASGEQRDVLAMFLESPDKANEVAGRLNDPNQTKTFQDLATELSTESVSKNKGGDFGWVPIGVLPDLLNNPDNKLLEDKVFSPDTAINVLTQVPDPDLNKDIGYWLLKITEHQSEGNKVHLYAMLLPDEAKAKAIKARLDAGEDFVTVAKTESQFSNASTDGGDFGLINQDDLKSKLGETVTAQVFPDDAAKAMELNKVSDPLADISQTTKGGVWLFKVTGVENKTIEGENRTLLANQIKEEWNNTIWTNNTENQGKIQTLWTEEQQAFAIQEVLNP